ncbi:hypothetical protein CTheo_3787 [Ceratobasidium theobromae]|uniref:Uncharacterized protein n=1 Tax=Ceratobasidium theobromae TaxID=1582974 RepID=A0A5N5QML1_9AGAM|nr:hypothetical protein CTheo_3787 [Ceratobasidium theobromae]
MPLIDSFNGIDLNVNNVNLPIPNLGPAIQVADVDNFNGGPQGIAEPGIDVMGPEGPVVEFEVGEPVAFPQDGIDIGPIAVLPQSPQPMAHAGDHVDAGNQAESGSLVWGY